MQLVVKVLQGSELSFEVAPHHSIAHVKLLVKEKLDVLPAQQRLVLKGRTLSDDSTLKDNNIIDGTKLFLSIKKSTDSSSVNSHNSSDTTAVNPAGKNEQHSVLWIEMEKLLLRHFGKDDTGKILQHIKQEYKKQLSQLSLDDIERLAHVNLEAKRESG
ncbi:ubiquitin-like protein 4A [Tubulanus polymorphus]|uniref:ubiquitin-like protein 4A n=1 Tax=Tubulanus polymorphus TaxID=672921 RepID=UPI003DA520A3